MLHNSVRCDPLCDGNPVCGGLNVVYMRHLCNDTSVTAHTRTHFKLCPLLFFAPVPSFSRQCTCVGVFFFRAWRPCDFRGFLDRPSVHPSGQPNISRFLFPSLDQNSKFPLRIQVWQQTGTLGLAQDGPENLRTRIAKKQKSTRRPLERRNLGRVKEKRRAKSWLLPLGSPTVRCLHRFKASHPPPFWALTFSGFGDPRVRAPTLC